MPSLWDDLPADLRDSGSVDSLEPLLDSVETPTESEESDADGAWRVYSTSLGDEDPLSLDPSTGDFKRGPGSGATPLEFPDPRVSFDLRLHLDAPGGDPDGRAQLVVATPRAIVRLPSLRGAKLDPQGQLQPDPDNREVKFHLPALRIRVERLVSEGISVKLLSASTTEPPVEEIYEFVRMEPGYALVGPGNTFGFAFRTAVLDLSGTSGPSGVPASALAMPVEWQGFYLPEARIFVSPNGLEGLAVNGGVRDLWIGIGDHAGVTGLFEAELVNRGSAPTVRLRFQTPNGEWIGVPDIDPASPVELPEDTRLYVDAGGGIAPLSTSIDVGGTVVVSDRVDVVTPSSGTVAIEVAVSDAGSHTTNRSISAVRRSANGSGASPPSGSPDVTITHTSAGPSRIELVSWSATHAVVRLDPGGGSIDWSWPGGSTTGETATVPVAEGATVSVTATRTLPTTIDCYMLFDRPEVDEEVGPFSGIADRTHTEPAGTRVAWAGGYDFTSSRSIERFAEYPTGTTWAVDGYASYEGDNTPRQQERNEELSRRRRDVMVTILREKAELGTAVSAGAVHGHAVARGDTPPPDGRSFPPGSASWWRATATASIPGSPTETATADLERPSTPGPVPDVDPAPTQAPRPDCFRKLGARVELIRGTFVRAEIYGEFDFHTAAEQRLDASGADPLPPRTNPSDGISTFLVRMRITEDRSSWDVTAEFRAVEGDLDGLAKSEVSTPGSSPGLNVLGAVSALSPLLAAATPPSPRDGELVPLVVVSAAAIGIGASGVMDVKHVILRGGELMVTDGLVDPATGSGPDTTQVSVLLDLETAFTFDLGFIRVRPESPIVTRYKATGFRSTWSSVDQPDGTVEYVPLPVFDPSKGYTLDVPAGSLVAADPLGEILRILGVQVARDNPTYLEVEVGMGVDLGIITVDTARVRLRLDSPEPPELTKLGASLEIPGTLHGKGVVEVTSTGFRGAFDLSIVPLSLRASAVLAIESALGVTGVLIGAEVEFPVPIVLGSSGLGIFGFTGGVGVNFARNEPTGVTTPALRWLEDQLRLPGNVMAPDGWILTPGAHAFAAGMLVGTLEGGYIVHLKGIVLIELPGPRLLLVMKADVLKAPPVLDSDQTAAFLAVLDIDFGRGTITIGIVAEYRIEKLLKIRIPVTAFFNTNDSSDWFVDLGTFFEPVTIEILDVLRGVGYLMIHGDGIDDLPLPIATSGLTVAVGFHLEAVLMGSKSIGLYLEVAAGFDAVVSFEPFAIGGRIYARGELRLFIISIGASAELLVLVGKHTAPSGAVTDRTYVHGEVCGKVDFFFFSIKACVSLTIGEEPDPIPEPPDLVAGVTLVSRTPALIEGSAIDRAVDGKIADALDEDAPAGATLPTVPLDAIPVIMFASPTDEAPGDIVLGGEAQGANGLPANPWLQRGDRWWRYRIAGVEIEGALQPDDGNTPATWWARGLPGDPSHGPALALLNWVPNPTPRAVTYGERLTTTVHERWGTICLDPARPAPVLWTFDGKPVGPSAAGWTLDGVPWPDGDDTHRSTPVDSRAEVDEPWRCGDEQADRIQGTDPAFVIGDAVPCPEHDEHEIVEDVEQWLEGQPSIFSEAAPPYDVAGAIELSKLLADGVSLLDAMPSRAEQSWNADFAEKAFGCNGRILRSPHGDDSRPAGGRDVEAEQVTEAWGRTGFAPSELANSVRLRCRAGLEDLTLLLLLPLQRAEGGFQVRYRDHDGVELGSEPVDHTHLVSGGNPVPAEWTDPDGPWADPVTRAGMIAARVAAGSRDQRLHLVRCTVPKGTTEVEMGWVRSSFPEGHAPLFHLVAATALTASEVIRHDWDATTTTREREVITTTLTQDPDDHALFVPGEEYTLRISWQGTSIQQDTQPPANEPVVWGDVDVRTQEFRFAADGADEAPNDLSPWLLASTPAVEEKGVLCREPVRIALATQNVAKLFAAYGEELRVVVHSATGRHPTPPNGAGPGAAVTIPTTLSDPSDSEPDILLPLAGDIAVMTPFETALRDVADGLVCIPDDVDREHHQVVTISYDFEPLTEYRLDIKAVPIGSPPQAVGRRVYRFSFATSRFDTVEDLARLVLLAPIAQSHVTDPTPLRDLADRPSGADLDAAFQAAGLSIPTTPRYPHVEVLWSGETIPQPVAVVIDSSEPLWRERPMPTEVPDPASDESPPHTFWAAIETPWLHPEAESTPAAADDLPRATVDRILRGPGDSRAVVLLAPGARGHELLLNLVVPANPLYGDAAQTWPIFGMHLRHAPWEAST